MHVFPVGESGEILNEGPTFHSALQARVGWYTSSSPFSIDAISIVPSLRFTTGDVLLDSVQ